ncbi:hydrocephalus-inducing protein-like [Bicyclus anynana]|uniref:Hydrocephalus-inducing protein-like n=1 Tax=Bicyclus anynana TaxID=110368 RepID=A0ABM3M7P0_BICAN|nr:hydrocephalus-inducing protein-like [Bicyclus anynana]
MNILHKFKQNGYFTAELYHLLSKKNQEDSRDEIIPSDYEREMKMSTMERIRSLSSIVVDNIVHSGKDSRIVLSFTPRIIVFQNFKPNDKIVAKFSVKNISKAPTYLNMVYKESVYFSIKLMGGQMPSRLAPGISVSFAVTFQPVHYEDYTHKVTFYTDIDQYVLPLIAMGPRPVFDFPDQIVVPKIPLKVENYLYYAIHNVGMVPAGFTLNVKCPFSVQPKSAYLNPKEKIDIRVGFKTMHLGETQGTMFATFETGENFRIKLTGSTYTVSVELEKQVVRFLDTYNTMVRQQTFKITNKSNHVLTYMCMKNECVYYDFEDKVNLATVFYDLKQYESAKSNKLVYYDVLSSEEHLRVYTRIFYDEMQALVADESLVFQNTHISITPIKGKLWPNKETELTITFAPKEIGEFDATVYLDIDGVDSRMPLKIGGTSLPPSINLNLETLDMDNVYINNNYNYEIVATNKGHINGIIEYRESAPLFGSIISCSPGAYCMRPGEKQTFIVSFCNSNQGPFFEEINFIIRDTSVVLKLYLKGIVIYPSLMFNIPCLDFGMVSVGVPKTMELEVINESLVDVYANIKISSDGPEMLSITLKDYAVAENPKPPIPQWPREFNIEPYKVKIGGKSTVYLRVTLTANLARANQTYLEMEIDKSDSPPIVLPVTFNAMVPQITPAPDIRMRACFTDFRYKQEVNIVCKDFWGYFTIEEPEEESTLEVEVGVKEGLIEPNSTITLPITIRTNVLGIQEYTIRLNLFGMSKPVEVCHIIGCGMRPIVTCNPIALHWGQVKLLTKTQKILTLCNDSPVTVNFRVNLLNRDGRWQINPTEGYIGPESETELIVSLYLIDANSYTNKAVIQLENVKDILVPLSSTGVGTSISISEHRDKILLGRHFTKIPLNCKVTMENCGTRLHALEWSQHYKAPKTKQHTTAFFNIEPSSFKLSAGEKIELTVTGLSSKVATSKEMWYLIGSVEGINKKELLLECQVVAEFVDPKIEVSSAIINFQYDYGPYSEYYKLTDLVTIKNVSKLPLDFEISVKPPFALIHKQESYKVPNGDEWLCGCICYNEADLNVPSIVNENGPERSKIFIDYLTLKPIDPVRKGPLHFFDDINKIKWAFNLTHTIEERLEDQEVMKIQILFDITKHTTLKAKVYCDLMRIRFKGHKNKDAIKLIGTINFPNIFVLTPKVDFQNILNGSIHSKTFKMQNITPLLVCYRFNWRKYTITKLQVNIAGEGLHEILPCRTPAGSVIGVPTAIDQNSLQQQQTKDDNLDSVINDSIIQYKYNVEYRYCRVMSKVLPMVETETDTEFEWAHKLVKQNKRYDFGINDILEVVPHSGLLKPNEVQYVNIVFRPKFNINVRVTLECEVLGGPTEVIVVTGQSSDLLYKLNTKKINFKIRSFHENATEVLIVSNASQLPFEFNTYLNEPTFENNLYGTILSLTPTNKVLEPEEQIYLQIEVRPGVLGYFHTSFLLELGHVPFVPIEIVGWGVIPQVYICLPRPDMLQLDPKLGYKAIPMLTQEYLEAINEMFTRPVSEHLNTPVTERCFEDRFFQQEWHICSAWDAYPSIMDIEMAIERMLVIEHITLRPDILNCYQTASKSGSIPGFSTTPYVIDFGVVITGSTIQCCVDIINYGPVATKLYFARGTDIPVWLTVKLCGKLNSGERGKLEATFAPTSNVFTELEQYIKTSFNIEVPYGVAIPIHIKAMCAVPYLVSNVSKIDFGSVRCGDKIETTISLKNVGKPPCIWFVNLKLKTIGTNALMVHDSSGKYDPGDSGWLTVSFKPTTEILYEGCLVFKFHMNPNKLIVPVVGQGIVPQVHIIGPNVTFPPTLPWDETSEIYFGITNPCPFPVELIITHSDKKWKEEEEIYQLLYKYYNSPEEMLVPAIKPGAGMPAEIVTFCENFKERVRKYESETDIKYTDIVYNVINEMKSAAINPLEECLHRINTTSNLTDTDKPSKGIIILVHGSPCEEMQCQEMAYSLGKGLNLPTVNIDSCIVDALCVCDCAAKSIMISAIDELYETALRNSKKDDEYNGEDDFDDDFDEMDTIDVIFKKLKYLAIHKNASTPHTKVNVKKKKKSTTTLGSSTQAAVGSTTMFHMDLILELLTEYFKLPKFEKGFILDTLTSLVITTPPLVLTTVIKSKLTIRNIHLLLCHSDFNKWARAYEELQREADLVDETVNKVYDEVEIKNIVKLIKNMESEEYENLSSDLKAIYVTYGLEERRRKHYEKVGFLHETMSKDKTFKDTVYSKSIITVNESKKKIKKDDLKGKQASEYVLMNTKYTDYLKNTYEKLLNIANNWIIEDGDVGSPLYDFTGQVVNLIQKKSKKKSDLQIQGSEENFSQRGFPLTIINCPCLLYKDALLNMFKNVCQSFVRQVVIDEDRCDILKTSVSRKVYTVLLPRTFPTINHEEPLEWCYLDEPLIKKCECNQLNDLNLLDDTNQDNVLNILSKWHCTCGKKLASSQTSTSEIPSSSMERTTTETSEANANCPLPLRAVQPLLEYSGRIILHPGDLVRFKYAFSPQYEGNFNIKRFVEVSGWPDSRAEIIVTGICDIPRLDCRPKKMFENFARRTVKDTVYKVTYLDDQKLFEFGPIFIGPQRIYEETYTIDLRNASLITTDIVIEFLEDTTIFEIDKTFVRLEPGCRGKISISAAPTEVGVFMCNVLFCVKDNPEIVTVTIACSGVVPIVEILPLTKTIEYGKHLLYRREDDRFIVKNDSILPILYKIRNAEEFVEDFIISKTTSIVPRHDNEVVPVSYIAIGVGVIQNKPMILDIYDAEGRGGPMITDTLLLSAECYDVMVECAYEIPSENYLNYGNVKVNSTVVREMYMLNRGRYNVFYKLKKVKSFPEPSLLKSFSAVPECGVIPPSTKLITTEFECTPTTSMNLLNVPAYICSLLDGSKNQIVVAKFPVCVTIASFYNTFTLFPLGELNFNIIAVGSSVTREVILNNTSKCPFTFTIVLPKKYQIDPDDPQPQVKLRDNKLKNTPLRCGNFLIMNDDNLLAPGTSRTLNMQFTATAATTFEETINFIISDTCPAEAQGVPLKLVGTGAMPTLDFWNIENTFREHVIVKNLSDYKEPETSAHCVFAEDSVALHFFSVTINSKFVAVIDLYNSGLVACALTMKLHYQANSNQDIYSLDKYETHIEPLLHKNLGIIFTPKTLQEYRAVLEIRLKLLQNQEQSFKICLIGEGVIPRITLIAPTLTHQRMGVLHFPVTCLGSISVKKIRLKNVSSVEATVTAKVLVTENEERPVFWVTSAPDNDQAIVNNKKAYRTTKITVKPGEIDTIYVNYNPIRRGRTSCDIKLTISKNPYEQFAVLCEAEAFMEDVILMGLEMLSMDTDVESFKKSADGTISTISTADSRKKSKSAVDKTKIKQTEGKKSKRTSQASFKLSDTGQHSVLKYLLNFGGCELHVMHKRSVTMVNNCEKVYKFEWDTVEHLVIKPNVGYISPGEEKDIEIAFICVRPISIKKEILNLNLKSICVDFITLDLKATTWDNRQTLTVFNNSRGVDVNERHETMLNDEVESQQEIPSDKINIVVFYSAVTEYTKYKCNLAHTMNLPDTFIYQVRDFSFQVDNTGKVPFKIAWNFTIDEEYPTRIDKYSYILSPYSYGNGNHAGKTARRQLVIYIIKISDSSKITLFSGSERRESVDTWFEVDLPFVIEPAKDCLKPNESRKFKVTFAPLDAFLFNVRLKSNIDNLDPYDQNISCKISAKSLVPYVHLDIEESDYLTSGRRKVTGVTLPEHTTVLEFNVLGSGCYKKTFDVINPTCEGYEFVFEMVLSDKPELIPMHCNMLKGYVEGGTSTEVVFTFSPTSPGVYESQWKFVISAYNLVINLLVVGIVREPIVNFVPTILIIRNSLVGFKTNNEVILRNNESECLSFEFKGNSICDESGKTPVIVEPEKGVLKPKSDTSIKIIYTPIQDGPLSFKIFCSITYLTKMLTLCVNALSYSIKPKVTYYLIGNDRILNSDAVTNIHLDQTASTYERTVPFVIKNDGSATFFFDWNYDTSEVKKYLQLYVEPVNGYVTPANEVECVLHFTLKKVPVQAFPVTLSISDGPEYSIYLHAEIEKPLYSFSFKEYDFGKCIVNAPDTTYKKSLAFENDDKVIVTLSLNFTNSPELYVVLTPDYVVDPRKRLHIPIYFRPKLVKEYEFKLQFWVNSLCEEIVTIKGEGVPLLFDLYEGCQKSFNLGAVKVGEKIVRPIEVMNHSKVPIEATFLFKVMYQNREDNTDVKSEGTSVCLSPTPAAGHAKDQGPSRIEMLQQYKQDKIQEQIDKDSENALSSLKVIPNKCTIKPYMKVPVKIQFKPVGMISNLDVQLNMRVFKFERPLVKLSGSATGMSLHFSQNSMQFGRVRKRGCKILKVMLFNKGDFGAKFWWQPLVSNEFTISPMQGNVAAHTNVTFTVTFRPVKHNPFIKVWASCNIENYPPQEIALYATCIDTGNVQTKSLLFECPVREVNTQYVTVTNPSDDMWLVLSEVTSDPFETLKEFYIEANSTFNIPIHFKPKTMGKHESQVLFSPLGEAALFVTLEGNATQPNPNGTINITVSAKQFHTQDLAVYNITEFPEAYIVVTEVCRIIPDKFDGFYEITHAQHVKVWGEAAGTCRWTIVCYEVAEIYARVMFINEASRECQFYNIVVQVKESQIVDTLSFTARARESVQCDLKIQNPLSKDASFSVKSDKLTCIDNIEITRKSEAILNLVYAPLVVGEMKDTLEVSNQLAGTYIYELKLKCLPAKVKKLEFTTSLGSSLPLRLRVQNKTDVRTSFTATVSHPSIITDPYYNLGPFEKGKFLAWFEPTELGVQNCTVSFNSPVAGEFVFSIKGIAKKPNPQGPFEIKLGGSTTITFKNVFADSRMFKINVDSEEFYTKSLYEPVRAKKDLKIVVYLTDVVNRASLPTGCLSVETFEPPEPRVQWTYFLKGIL